MIEPPEEQVMAGKIAAGAIRLGMELCRNYIDGEQLDANLEEYILDEGGTPGLKGYHPVFALKPYQHTICLGINNDVVHCVPNKLLDPNYMITIDLVVQYQGWYADTARTFTYSNDVKKKQFIQNSNHIFQSAKDCIMPNQPISAFGSLVGMGAYMLGYKVIKEYCGHGIGRAIHIDPQIPNYETSSTEVFQVGRAYAVEPVLSMDSYKLKHNSYDGFSVTSNGWASHFEDTIFIGLNGAINLTGNET